MDSMTLREAARRTSRSVTTLRRYIRTGRLHADKRAGRFGPEYFVSDGDLAEAGLVVTSGEPPTAIARSEPADGPLATTAPPELVPASLYRELQMKHEQLLVQYGMMRAGGMRVLELRADLEAAQQELERSRNEITDLKRGLGSQTDRLEQRRRESALEHENRGQEVSALRAKLRGFEMATRNAVTNASVERQFREIMTQTRRVDRLSSPLRGGPADPPIEPEH